MGDFRFPVQPDESPTEPVFDLRTRLHANWRGREDPEIQPPRCDYFEIAHVREELKNDFDRAGNYLLPAQDVELAHDSRTRMDVLSQMVTRIVRPTGNNERSMPHVIGSLRALLSNLIDYAGLYPPASLPLDQVSQNYERYLGARESWILNRLVLPAAKLPEVQLGDSWRVSLLVEEEPGPLPRQVESLETKGSERLSLPTYCETQLDRITGAFAKIRTGGVTADAILPSDVLGDYLHRAADRRLPFKATAGLHHPIRSVRPLTYASDSPRVAMHGFVNVFVAAAFTWHHAQPETGVDVLEETDARAFQFGEDGVRWRSLTLSTAQIQSARREFAHSFGSCSFEEPVCELRDLGWLP